MNWLVLISAIMTVETGGHPDPLNAVGDGGASIGCLQIQRAVIQDVNRVYGTDYTVLDRRRKRESFEICQLYLTYWGEVYERKTGKAPTFETYARIWNGGAYGWKKTGVVKGRLDEYWAKVENQIKEQG